MKWIDMNHHFPDDGETVIVYEPSRKFSVYTATFINYRSLLYFQSEKFGRVNTDSVTHWMAMPKPPECEELEHEDQVERDAIANAYSQRFSTGK